MLKRVRRWTQFSLRAFLVTVLVFCVVLARKVDQANRNREVAQMIRNLGGNVYYLHEWDEENTALRNRSLPIVCPGPRWLRNIIGNEFFHTLVVADFNSAPVTDEDLATLSRIGTLQCLLLCDAEVTNEGIRNLENMTHLQHLDLSGTHVTDEGLEHLTHLDRLRYLSLERLSIRGDGLRHLSLDNLESLDLSQTAFSDDNLKWISPLTRLTDVELHDTPITTSAIHHLESLPNLEYAGLAGTKIPELVRTEFEKQLPFFAN